MAFNGVLAKEKSRRARADMAMHSEEMQICGCENAKVIHQLT